VAAPQRALRPEYDRRYTREQASLTKVEQVSSYLGEAQLGREGDGGGSKGRQSLGRQACIRGHRNSCCLPFKLDWSPPKMVFLIVLLCYVLYCTGPISDVRMAAVQAV